MSVVLPDPQRRDLLQFYIAKNLPYAARLVMALVLLLVGIALEMLLPYPGALIGLVLLFAGGLLLAPHGYTNRPEFIGPGFWKTTDVDRLRTILDLHQKSRSWDLTTLEISNALGFLAFAAFVCVVGAVAFVFLQRNPDTSLLIAASGAAILLPIWFSGWRAGWGNNELYLKARLVQDLAGYFETIRKPDEKVQVSLRLNGTEADAVPQDVKLQISFPEASPDFYGVQGQININNVQGNKYPYGYFVVVAKRGMGILPLARGRDIDGKVTVETKPQSDVEVIVVRQYTTRTSGYHTKPKQIRALMDLALAIARQVAAAHPKS